MTTAYHWSLGGYRFCCLPWRTSGFALVPAKGRECSGTAQWPHHHPSFVDPGWVTAAGHVGLEGILALPSPAVMAGLPNPIGRSPKHPFAHRTYRQCQETEWRLPGLWNRLALPAYRSL